MKSSNVLAAAIQKARTQAPPKKEPYTLSQPDITFHDELHLAQWLVWQLENAVGRPNFMARVDKKLAVLTSEMLARARDLRESINTLQEEYGKQLAARK